MMTDLHILLKVGKCSLYCPKSVSFYDMVITISIILIICYQVFIILRFIENLVPSCFALLIDLNFFNI